jgi:hypothetical protein
MSYNDDDEYDDLDEYEGSKADYAELGDNVDFDLFEMQGGTAQLHGSLKSWKTQDGSLIYYKDDPTGFTISVERLLQADGYADSTEKQRLTLFVLKLVLACNSSSRIKRVVFNMRFEDIPQKGRNKANANKMVKPEIQAWAPFDEMVKTNEIDVDRENKKKADLELGGEGAGATGKGSVSWESTIKWTEKYWESGHAYPTFSKEETRTGVRWVLNANPKDTQGLPPNFMVGILLSRQSDEPYLANFNIKVTGGLIHDLLNGIERLLGRKPDVTKPYKVTPSKKAISRYTGLNMLKKVKSNGMLELKGKGDDLVLVWDDEKTDSAEKKEGKAAAEKEEPAPSVAK